DVLAAGADAGHELDLVVQVLREAGIADGARLPLRDNHRRISGLEEEEGRFAAGEAHLLGVLHVIAADAVDAAHGEALGAADDGHGDLRRGVEDVAHDNLSSEWMPSASCTGRSEKLKRTQPLRDARRAVCHEGTTK